MSETITATSPPREGEPTGTRGSSSCVPETAEVVVAVAAV